MVSRVSSSFVTLSFLQDPDHRGGSNKPSASVLFQGEELLVASHEELCPAGLSQREQVAVLWVRRGRSRWQVPAIKRKVAKARRKQLGRACAEPRAEKRPAGDVAEFRYERIGGDQRELLALPGIK